MNDDDKEWLDAVNASVARINHVIRTSGGNHFWDMKTFKEMVTVLNGPPRPAWPLVGEVFDYRDWQKRSKHETR